MPLIKSGRESQEVTFLSNFEEAAVVRVDPADNSITVKILTDLMPPPSAPRPQVWVRTWGDERETVPQREAWLRDIDAHIRYAVEWLQRGDNREPWQSPSLFSSSCGRTPEPLKMRGGMPENA